MDWELAGGVTVTGLVVVFVALIILIACVWIISKLIVVLENTFSKPGSEPAPVKPKTASPVKSSEIKPIVETGIEEEVVAVISAAIASSFGSDVPSGGYVITSISRSVRPVWGFAGMQQNTRPF